MTGRVNTRIRKVTNYALLGKRGFQSADPIRRKKAIKRNKKQVGEVDEQGKRVSRSAPASPKGPGKEWAENNRGKKGPQMEKTKKKAKSKKGNDHGEGQQVETREQSGVQRGNAKVNNGKECDNGECERNGYECETTEALLQTVSDTLKHLNSHQDQGNNYLNLNVTGQTSPVVEMESRKKNLLASIANLKQQLKNKEEEDQELQELIKQEAELKRKLSQSEPVKVTQSSKKGEVNLDGASLLQNMTGIKFDMSGNLGEECDIHRKEVDEFISIADSRVKKVKRAKSSKVKRRRTKRRVSSSSSSSSSESEAESSESSSEEEEVFRDHGRKERGRKVKSGLFDKSAQSKLVSKEWYAHSALEEIGCRNKDMKELSFNLLVAGELEIIMSNKIGKKEQITRMELLRKLAYRHEVLPLKEIVELYSNFLGRVEKGKYKWGSKSAMRQLDNEIIFALSLERRGIERKWEGRDKKRVGQGAGIQERKKYCMEYNKGMCNLNSPHEGRLGNNVVMKYHICRRCLAEESQERYHTERECPLNRK